MQVFLWSTRPMSDEPNTETAFPAMTPGGYCTPGMTLRDWFAGQLLAGIAANDNYSEIQTAKLCYRIAEFMIAVRELTPDTTTAQQIALGIGGGK
jgi:hypothetical protein